MNREETKAAIAVMQAYVDGEDIQLTSRCLNQWQTALPTPDWQWGDIEYRIKPKPREFYLYAVSANNEWRVVPPNAACSGMIKVVEVIE